jgi:4-diphosphocytidyl-2-C-methyl-D-erythritol kinase
LDLHDLVTVKARRAEETWISLTTNHPYVPTNERNTAWRMVERCLAKLDVRAEVEVHIEKNLPVQGGLGAGSANGAAALIGLERELGVALPGVERLHLAAEIGSDVPLFLLGGAVMGVGRGEQVVPMPDLPRTYCVVAVPAVGVSTPAAFKEWDVRHTGLIPDPKLDRLNELSHAYASLSAKTGDSKPGTSGIVRDPNPEKKQGLSGESQSNAMNDLAENTLLTLVRTGIGNDGLQNDFEEVVFPQYPSLRITKRQLMGSDSDGPVVSRPAIYAALSGSGSALFGLYRSEAEAKAAQQRVQSSGVQALLTETLPRAEYWERMFAE